MILAPILGRVKVYGAIIAGATILCLAGYSLVEFTQPVAAAPADPAVPDCVAIGKSGPLVVSRCEDEKNGQIIYVNNYGMMVIAP